MASLAQQRTALFREWMREIMRNPIDDLRHRWSHFRALMAFDRQRVCYPYEARIFPNAFGFTTPLGRPGFSSPFCLADAFADAWFFRAWVWTGLAVLLSTMALMPAIGSPLAAAVAASGGAAAAEIDGVHGAVHVVLTRQTSVGHDEAVDAPMGHRYRRVA